MRINRPLLATLFVVLAGCGSGSPSPKSPVDLSRELGTTAADANQTTFVTRSTTTTASPASATTSPTRAASPSVATNPSTSSTTQPRPAPPVIVKPAVPLWQMLGGAVPSGPAPKCSVDRDSFDTGPLVFAVSGVPQTARANSHVTVSYSLTNQSDETVAFRYSANFAALLSRPGSLVVESGVSVGSGAYQAPLVASLGPGASVTGTAVADLVPCAWDGSGEAPAFAAGPYQLRVRGVVFALDGSSDATGQTPQARITSQPYSISVAP